MVNGERTPEPERLGAGTIYCQLNVSKELRRELRVYRSERDLRSYEQAIRHLLNEVRRG